MADQAIISLNKSAISARLDVAKLAPVIEQAYQAASSGAINLPPVGHIVLADHDGDCHIKYGHQLGDDVFVIKVATGFPHNDPALAPPNNGVSLVLSATTGQVVAVLHDEGLMTDVRTGLGGAIASRALARPDASRVLVVGTGVLAPHQINAHRALFDRPLDIAVWGRSEQRAQAVADANSGLRVESDLAKGCAEADIIVTITAAREPIVRDEWVSPGTHITAVGADAPGKHELDAALLDRADCLVADSASQCIDHGEFSALAHTSRIVELGAVLDGSAAGRTSDDQLSVADLTGIAAQDIAIAKAVLAS